MKLKTTALLGAAALALMAGSASAADLACLITKNNTNPFFVKMKEGAEAAAAAAGLDFQAYAGEKDGDAAPQITAIENCVAAGAKGILITASNDSVGPALKDARAAGILVIALDTPIADPEAQDMTFATDNFEAGILIGKWAAATLGAALIADGLTQLLATLRAITLEGGEEDRLFVLEGLVQAALRQAGGLRQIADRGAVVAALAEHAHCIIQSLVGIKLTRPARAGRSSTGLGCAGLAVQWRGAGVKRANMAGFARVAVALSIAKPGPGSQCTASA